MRELLIQLDGEFKTGRSATGPAAAHVLTWLTVKRGVHFDRVEVFGVVGELVEALGPPARRRIEHAVPRTSAGRIIPPRSANSDIRHLFLLLAGPHPRSLALRRSKTRYRHPNAGAALGAPAPRAGPRRPPDAPGPPGLPPHPHPP